MFLSTYYNYISQYFNREEQAVANKREIFVDDDFVKVGGFVSIQDLKSVHLTPVIKEIVPNPSRNAPPCFSKVDLRNLNRAQLNCILNVKLKPVPLPSSPTAVKKIYEVRHPCLRELLKKRNVIY